MLGFSFGLQDLCVLALNVNDNKSNKHYVLFPIHHSNIGPGSVGRVEKGLC